MAPAKKETTATVRIAFRRLPHRRQTRPLEGQAAAIIAIHLARAYWLASGHTTYGRAFINTDIVEASAAKSYARLRARSS
jgi:hypothetical protein